MQSPARARYSPRSRYWVAALGAGAFATCCGTSRGCNIIQPARALTMTTAATAMTMMARMLSLTSAGHRHAHDIRRLGRQVVRRILAREPRRHRCDVAFRQSRNDALHAVGLGSVAAADTPARELRGDVRRA